MIRRLDPRVAQEAEHGAPVIMPAQFIEQPLMVAIFQTTVPQLIRELRLQRFGLDLDVSSGFSRCVCHNASSSYRTVCSSSPKSRARPVFRSTTSLIDRRMCARHLCWSTWSKV
jgi:hypothetical protein